MSTPENETKAHSVRRLTGASGHFVRGLAILLSVYIVVYISGGLDLVGIRLFGAHRALVFAGILLLVYLTYPASYLAPRNRVPLYDWACGIVGAGTALYAFINWNVWVYGVNIPSVPEQFLAVILVVLSLEAARRTLGIGFTLIGLIFVIYPLIGHFLPGLLVTNHYSMTQLSQFFYLSGGNSGIFGTPMEIFTTTVAVFLLFGAFLKATRASDLFMQISLSIAGRFRGGMAKVAVLSSALFAMISGVGVANVMITGGFTIPAMKRIGYRPPFAAAVEATASTGGILMPPIMGAAAFLMADILAVSYWTIVLAAFLPSVLYYIALYVMVDAEGGKHALKGVESDEIEPAGRTIARSWYLFAAIATLLFLIGYLGFPVDLSALIATAVLLGTSLLTPNRLNLRGIADALEESGLLLARIGTAGAVVGIIMSGFSLTGLAALLPTAMSALAGDNVFVLLLMGAIASVILGMGAPPLLVYIVLAATVAPALIKLDVLPLAAHMFIFYYGMLAMITPPVAMSVLIAAKIAETDFWQASLQAVRLGLVAFVVPFFFVYQPALLFEGTAVEILTTMITAVIGVVALGCGLSRYVFFRHAPVWEAALLIAGGFLLVFPGLASDAAGLGCILPSAIISVLRWQRGGSARSSASVA